MRGNGSIGISSPKTETSPMRSSSSPMRSQSSPPPSSAARTQEPPDEEVRRDDGANFRNESNGDTPVRHDEYEDGDDGDDDDAYVSFGNLRSSLSSSRRDSSSTRRHRRNLSSWSMREEHDQDEQQQRQQTSHQQQQQQRQQQHDQRTTTQDQQQQPHDQQHQNGEVEGQGGDDGRDRDGAGAGASDGAAPFWATYRRSRAALVLLIVSTLFSLGIGSVVGLVPDVAADRYARLYHDYNETLPCGAYNRINKPAACLEGSDRAQAASAESFTCLNVLSLLASPVIIGRSDAHGRKPPILASLFLFVVPAFAFYLLILIPTLDPIVYYGTNPLTGIISYFGLLFACLSDCFSEEHRTGAFGIVMAGTYMGYALGPALVVFLTHVQVSMLSFAFSLSAFIIAWMYLPETRQCFNAPSADAIVDVAPITLSYDVLQQQEEHQYHNHHHHHHHQITRIRPIYSILQPDDTSDEDEQERGRESPLCQVDEESASSLSSCIAGMNHKASSMICCTAGCQWVYKVVTRPVREMAILNATKSLRILAAASFLSSMVFASDLTLVIYYMEEYFDITDTDIAKMFLCLGIAGIALQSSLQPIVTVVFGGDQTRLLVATFFCGTIHNIVYGIAQSKFMLLVALLLSQVTKLNFPVLSAVASCSLAEEGDGEEAAIEGQGRDESQQQPEPQQQQGRIQGALFAVNALGYATGPLSMNYVYKNTKADYGPGFMFIYAAMLYAIGTVLVSFLLTNENQEEEEPSAITGGRGTVTDRRDDQQVENYSGNGLEEPLLGHQ